MLDKTKEHDGQSPFHAGEQMVQERLGVRDIEYWARQVVRDHLPEQHRAFHTALPFLVVAARDDRNRPWATILTGPQRFVHSPDPRHLVINARPVKGDALEGAFKNGSEIGVLGIELATRRRNRVNGKVENADADGLTFAVDQSFGNCPQYIRERAWHRIDSNSAGNPWRGRELTDHQQAVVSSADTFFIASGYRGEGENPAFGMDASHRGGDPGFVEVLDARRIRFPDYAGNNHFNTIGNIIADPRAGFLFIDFTTGSLLQMTGSATVDWDSDDISRFPGARRLLTLEIEEIVELPSAIALRWEAEAESVRSLRLVEKIRESADVTSFVFEARDGGDLPPFTAGQHLPVELSQPPGKENLRRTYSLSGAPADPRYRISVKREPHGKASTYLHDCLEPGAIIDARNPAGEFVLHETDAPVVLVSAGVGVTPVLSMLHDLAARGDGRPVLFVHGARDRRHHAFAGEVRDLADNHPNIGIHVAYSRPDAGDRPGHDYHSKGRVTGKLLAELVPAEEAAYYVCGPARFMADVIEDLLQMGVVAENIRTETFGPVLTTSQ
ncbi:pyridoxamine 5'-phosphate oxidase family protein [Hoeflea sp. TYP-13]|uniref:FAD-binding oxidoreductase n=1 Tax=Hoeflea sp. TYP-13 TaxID=3230023 RepID=UPI0034C6C6D9